MLHYHDSGPWWDWCFYEKNGPNGFTGLHGAAFLGIMEIATALLGMKEWDINVTDTLGRTALAWAAIGGHEEVVRILLQRKGINPNTADTQYDRTPLLWAAEGGHEGVVKLLLEREDIDPNTQETKYGRTPLLWAVERGHQGVVKLLLEQQDMDPNTPDTENGQTPLQWAAHHEHEGIVRLLLDREDINPNTLDNRYGRTPLLAAAAGGHEGVVGLLLQRKDLNPNTPDTEYGRTLLRWAAERGGEGIIMLLLEREDIDPNSPDTKSGQTPLLAAAIGRHEGVVGLLLKQKDVNPNIPDIEYGATPLRLAAQQGYSEIVKLLLERDLGFRCVRELSPTLYSLPSMFPLLKYASCYWGKHIRRNRTENVILLALGVLVRFEEHISSRLFLEYHPGCTREYGWGLSFDWRSSPKGFPGLHGAAVLGISEIVAALLTMKEWDINERDTVGRTALTWAAVEGYVEVVRILL